MMSHPTPKVMLFLPRSRASACSTRASVAPESGFRVVTTQRGTGAMTRKMASPMETSCPPQPCSAHASVPVIVMVMRKRRGSGAVPLNSGASAFSDASDISVGLVVVTDVLWLPSEQAHLLAEV